MGSGFPASGPGHFPPHHQMNGGPRKYQCKMCVQVGTFSFLPTFIYNISGRNQLIKVGNNFSAVIVVFLDPWTTVSFWN